MKIRKFSAKPKELSEEEIIAEAFHVWSLRYSAIERTPPQLSPPQKGWSQLKHARSNLQLSSNDVASKLGISRAGYHKLEVAEANNKITLESLEKAAHALDCELVYSIRPKNHPTFAHAIWSKMLPTLLKHPAVVKKTDKVKARVMVGIANMRFEDGKFRKRMGWSERCYFELISKIL